MRKFKKVRKTVFIDGVIHERILRLIEVHPELGYKRPGEFVNKILKEQLQSLENNAILKEIGEMGLTKFEERFYGLEARMYSLMTIYEQRSVTNKKLKRKLKSLKKEVTHTLIVYTLRITCIHYSHIIKY